MKYRLYTCILLVSLCFRLNADLETLGGDDVDISAFNQETLFISLGSYCAPASLVRSCGYRKAAFPFDWNIILDGEKLIEILNDDFANFLSPENLLPCTATLLNTVYHLEFVHDGSWSEQDIGTYMPLLQSKYSRRIERFKRLREHQGKVYFIRSAYINSIEDRHRFYKIKENIEISEDYSLRLYNALKAFFPTLNFQLVIINNCEKLSLEEEKLIDDSVLMVRASWDYTQPEMQEAYRLFFEKLMTP